MRRCRPLLVTILNNNYKRENSSGAEALGEFGSGAGNGGGKRIVRQAGGALGKYGAVREEEYFYKKQREHVLALKKQLEKQNCDYGQEVRKLQDVIDKNKKRIALLEKCFYKK
ncbi:hypothetical protein NQ314_019055 [Rhamnusium bicolor]|uniref:Uncharacterized protein n=1 Tax=Rhamnusium bicolor TaxID=1586634 RepID=A0AAV8WNM9_9CUCU|nr:hypothetical protein NQ314_019055 [Rhamnusium bicolor]